MNTLAGRDDRDMTSSNLPVEDYATGLQGDLQVKKIAVLHIVMDAITNTES